MPRAINQIVDFATGQVTSIEVPWTVESFRQELAAERWRRETAGVTVGPVVVSTMRDISSDIENQKAAWSAFMSELRARPLQPDMTYKNPETGIPKLLTRDEALRIGDCVSWYIEMCFRAELVLYEMAATANLDQLEAAMRSDVPNNPWPQREFDLIPQ